MIEGDSMSEEKVCNRWFFFTTNEKYVKKNLKLQQYILVFFTEFNFTHLSKLYKYKRKIWKGKNDKKYVKKKEIERHLPAY